MACISLGKLNPEKDIRFIVFNISQNFFEKEKWSTVDEFMIHLKENYNLVYNKRMLTNVLGEMAEDGFLDWLSSADRFRLKTLEL